MEEWKECMYLFIRRPESNNLNITQAFFFFFSHVIFTLSPQHHHYQNIFLYSSPGHLYETLRNYLKITLTCILSFYFFFISHNTRPYFSFHTSFILSSRKLTTSDNKLISLPWSMARWYLSSKDYSEDLRDSSHSRHSYSSWCSWLVL